MDAGRAVVVCALILVAGCSGGAPTASGPDTPTATPAPVPTTATPANTSTNATATLPAQGVIVQNERNESYVANIWAVSQPVTHVNVTYGNGTTITKSVPRHDPVPLARIDLDGVVAIEPTARIDRNATVPLGAESVRWGEFLTDPQRQVLLVTVRLNDSDRLNYAALLRCTGLEDRINRVNLVLKRWGTYDARVSCT